MSALGALALATDQTRVFNRRLEPGSKMFVPGDPLGYRITTDMEAISGAGLSATRGTVQCRQHGAICNDAERGLMQSPKEMGHYWTPAWCLRIAIKASRKFMPLTEFRSLLLAAPMGA